MNKPRRKALNEIYDQLQTLKDELEAINEEEIEYRDNIPENMQGGERYEKAENACDNLDSALCSIQDALDYIESATE